MPLPLPHPFVMSTDGCRFTCNPVSPGGRVGKRVLKLGLLLPAAVAPCLPRSIDVALSQKGGGAVSLDLLALSASVGDVISKPVKCILAREKFHLLSMHSVDSVPYQTHQYQRHREEQGRPVLTELTSAGDS